MCANTRLRASARYALGSSAATLAFRGATSGRAPSMRDGTPPIVTNSLIAHGDSAKQANICKRGAGIASLLVPEEHDLKSRNISSTRRTRGSCIADFAAVSGFPRPASVSAANRPSLRKSGRLAYRSPRGEDRRRDHADHPHGGGRPPRPQRSTGTARARDVAGRVLQRAAADDRHPQRRPLVQVRDPHRGSAGLAGTRPPSRQPQRRRAFVRHRRSAERQRDARTKRRDRARSADALRPGRRDRHRKHGADGPAEPAGGRAAAPLVARLLREPADRRVCAGRRIGSLVRDGARPADRVGAVDARVANPGAHDPAAAPVRRLRARGLRDLVPRDRAERGRAADGAAGERACRGWLGSAPRRGVVPARRTHHGCAAGARQRAAAAAGDRRQERLGCRRAARERRWNGTAPLPREEGGRLETSAC